MSDKDIKPAPASGGLTEYSGKWIAVTERLPPHLDIVLVQGGVAMYHERNQEWRTITGCRWPGRVIEWRVTHWMPLPPAPVDAPDSTKAK